MHGKLLTILEKHSFRFYVLLNFYYLKLFNLFYILTEVSRPSSSLVPSPHLHSGPTYSSLGYQQSEVSYLEAGSCIHAGRCNSAWGTGSKKPAHRQERGPRPTTSNPQTYHATHLSTTCRGPRSLFHAGSLPVGPESMNSQEPN